MNLHCSACRTAIPASSQFCPGCALPLSAFAVATASPAEKRVPLWAVLLACVAIAGVLVSALSADENAQHEKAKAAFVADLHSGKLATPAAFQAICGPAAHTLQQGNDTILSYESGGLHVHFVPGQPATLRRVTVMRSHGRFHELEMPADEASAFADLGCRAQ